MKVSGSRLGALLAGVYLLLVAGALVWGVVTAQDAPPGGGVDLLAFYLTLPWSLISVVTLEIVSAGLMDSYLALLTVVLLSAALNAVILYFLGSALARRRTRREE